MKSTNRELQRLTRKTDKLKPRSTALDLLLLVIVLAIAVLAFEVTSTFLKGALR